jgi:hypothetical protein
LGGAGAGADPPQAPNNRRAATKDLQMQTLRMKCSGLVNDRKARDEKIKSMKTQVKEKVSATKETIVEKKAHLQVVVAREKMLLKVDSKDLEFERKMNREDKRAMQRTGGKIGNFMSKSGWWAL